ncbi:hypothetical protein YC2023_050652 [Brassica napus]
MSRWSGKTSSDYTFHADVSHHLIKSASGRERVEMGMLVAKRRWRPDYGGTPNGYGGYAGGDVRYR